MTNSTRKPESSRPRSMPVAGAQHQETAFERVQAILEQLGQGAADCSVRLFRMTAGRPAYLEPFTLSPNLYDEVKELHGGGDFRADVIDGRGKVFTHFAFSIFGPPKAQQLPVPVAPASVLSSVPAGQPPAPPGSDVTSKLLDRLDALEDRLANPPRDPVADFIRMAEVFKTVQGGEKRESMLDMANALFEFQDRVAERLGKNDGERRDPIVALAEEIGRPLVTALAARQGQQGPADHIQPAAVSERGPAPAPASMPAGEKPPLRLVDQVPMDADPIVKLLADIPMPARAALRGMAAANTDPESACNVAMAMLSDPQVGRLAEQVHRADFLDVMLGAIPTFQPYREWFGAFVSAVRASLADEEVQAGTGGDAGTTDDSPAQAAG